MSTRTRMATIWCGLMAATTIALVAAQVGLSLQMQTLPLVPEIQNPPDRGASIWVFELPDRLVRR